jgi:hypothetical protein
MGPNGCLTPSQNGQLAIGHTIILTLTVTVGADIHVLKCSAYTKLLIPPILNPYMSIREQQS